MLYNITDRGYITCGIPLLRTVGTPRTQRRIRRIRQQGGEEMRPPSRRDEAYWSGHVPGHGRSRTGTTPHLAAMRRRCGDEMLIGEVLIAVLGGRGYGTPSLSTEDIGYSSRLWGGRRRRWWAARRIPRRRTSRPSAYPSRRGSAPPPLTLGVT